MWTDTGLSREDLVTERRKVWRHNGRQILLLVQNDRLFAIANRCPHEGYPLSEGTDGPGCSLVCNWHGWRFDLETGTALIGRDPVRTYPVELRDGRVFVELAEQSPELQRDRIMGGLDQAIADIDGERMAREVARLDRAGFPVEDALRHAVERSSDRFEFGMEHAYAAAPDWLALRRRSTDPGERLAALIEPLYHIAWDVEGNDEFPYASGKEPWNAAAFITAIDEEDEVRAQRLVAGAFEAGFTYPRLRPAFAAAALRGYADFGHSAIYVLKAGQLIATLGDEISGVVTRALVRSLAMAMREDRLPEFRGYADALAGWGQGKEPAVAAKFRHLSINGAIRTTLASSGRPPREIYDALLDAAGWNQLHFDTAWSRRIDGPIADNVDWLDFTHALTFANAIRHLCEETPALWPAGLLQLALFAGRNRKYVEPGLETSRWQVTDTADFLRGSMEGLYDHSQPEPIISAHMVKVLFALEDEIQAAPEASWGPLWTAAVNRFLNTPLKRRHSLRNAVQALEFIASEG